MIDIFKRWFSHSKEQNLYDSQNPWAGLASYEDPETAERKLKFCGRDDDSYDLARLVMGNVFVTLYGKSGIGKTSLLNAGVFPELREEQYTPVSIRLGMRDEEHPQSYQTMMVEAVERVVKRTETINVIAEQQDQQSTDFLWNYFARHRFFDKNDKPTTPVIVFDQFEEVFRGHRDEAETLLRQLDYLNDKDHMLDSCEVDGQPYRYEQNFRFVVSIREDDLYHLEDSIDNCYLPALKRCRYRLRSLSEEGARDAILIPGEGLFKAGEKDFITKAIINKSRNFDGNISTNIISLLCSRIYVDFKNSGADHITPSLVDNFIKGNPFERFYNEATQGFSNKEKSYIEEHLVDSTGRRNSISESDFLLHVPKGLQLLEGDTRILQRTSTSSDGGSYRIELIHDSFCKPLSNQKEIRNKRKRLIQMTIACIAIVIALILVLYPPIFRLFHFYTYDKQGLHVSVKGLSSEQEDVLTSILDDMVLVDGGTFMMGNTEEMLDGLTEQDSLSVNPHEVELDNYYICKYEVTQKQWRAFFPTEGKCIVEGEDRDRTAMDKLSWEDAKAFAYTFSAITGLQFDLPTEAQWEFAARGGNKTHRYIFSGHAWDATEVGWTSFEKLTSAHEVGGKRYNELGLYDMTGNVFEWCADYFELYSKEKAVNPQGPSKGLNRVLRGGDFRIENVYDMKVSTRYHDAPFVNRKGAGLRLVINVK